MKYSTELKGFVAFIILIFVIIIPLMIDKHLTRQCVLNASSLEIARHCKLR